MENDGIECGLVTGQNRIIKTNMVATIGSVKKIPDLTRYKMLIKL